MTNELDDILVARSRRGDEEAFRMLYRRYEVRLMRYLLQLCGNRQTAEETFQETLLEIVLAKNVSAEEGSIARWLFVVARNKFLNRARAERGHASLRLGETPDGAAVTLPDAETQITDREDQAALAKAVKRLPTAMREVYAMRLSGMALEDIAATLSVPTGTVKSRLNRLIQKLKEDLS